MSELRQVDVKALRALEDERDALLEQVVYWRECATEAKAERDALREQLRVSRSEEMHLRERLRNLHILKAQWQAEALETFASSIRANNEEGNTADLFGMARLIETSAAQFRRQAEGGE